MLPHSGEEFFYVTTVKELREYGLESLRLPCSRSKTQVLVDNHAHRYEGQQRKNQHHCAPE
jgi:hypothetical protein